MSKNIIVKIVRYARGGSLYVDDRCIDTTNDPRGDTIKTMTFVTPRERLLEALGVKSRELTPKREVTIGVTVNLDVVRSLSGTCLYVDGDNRIGPKPTGSTKRAEKSCHISIEVPRAELLAALKAWPAATIDDAKTVTIGGEMFEIDSDFRSIRKILAIGDVVKTVEVTFGDPDVASLSPDPVELEAEQLLVPGRIVRYVDVDGVVFPAIVTHVYDEMHVDLQVFPRQAAPYPLTRVMRHLLGKMARIANTWHWPSDR